MAQRLKDRCIFAEYFMLFILEHSLFAILAFLCKYLFPIVPLRKRVRFRHLVMFRIVRPPPKEFPILTL